MAKVTFKDNPVTLAGELPAVGSQAPDFLLTGTDLTDKGLKDYAGKKVILNIFPSIDTPVCATSTKKFNGEADKLSNVAILCVSRTCRSRTDVSAEPKDWKKSSHFPHSVTMISGRNTAYA